MHVFITLHFLTEHEDKKVSLNCLKSVAIQQSLPVIIAHIFIFIIFIYSLKAYISGERDNAQFTSQSALTLGWLANANMTSLGLSDR